MARPLSATLRFPMTKEAITLSQLGGLLDERNAHPGQESELDKSVWQRCGADRGILVLDLSGFTRLTRSHGILHFLAVFRRAWHLACPVVRAHCGRIVKCEADNVIGSFDSASDALAAAIAMMEAAQQLNRSLDEDSRVRMCIAVGWGHILELQDDFFGDEVNITFKLGEDVARPGEVLVTESAMARLAIEGTAVGGDDVTTEVGRVQVSYRRLAPCPDE